MQPAFCICVLMKPFVSTSVLTLPTYMWNKRNVCFPRLKNLGVSWCCIEITPTCDFYLNKTMNSFWKYKISFLDSVTSFSHGNVSFGCLTPGPRQEQHPGYDDFYNSSLLQEFMEATQVRLHLHGSTVQLSTLLTGGTDAMQWMRSP